MFLSFLALIWSLFVMAYGTVFALLWWMHTVLPWSVDFLLLVTAVARLTRLRRAEVSAVDAVFSADGGAPVKFIAHRGAALDAPENTMQAFKYCVDRGCSFVEFDVRITSDGECVLFHDLTLSRMAQLNVDIAGTKWDNIKDIDVSIMHPLKDRYKESKPVLLDEALDYLVQHKIHMLIDLKVRDKRIVDKLVATFRRKPELYTTAVVTSFNPLMIYQIRRADPRIIGALAFKPDGFSSLISNSEEKPGTARFLYTKLLHVCANALDITNRLLWNSTLIASWCGVSAVLIRKDCISQHGVSKWRSRGYRVLAWTVNHPAEKNYLHRTVGITYLSDTLVGELREERVRIDRASADWEEGLIRTNSLNNKGSAPISDTPTRNSSEPLKQKTLDGSIQKAKLTNGAYESVITTEKI